MRPDSISEVAVICPDVLAVETDDPDVTSGQVASAGVDARNVCKEQQSSNANIKVCSLFSIE
jgi:hypothetical protein